MTKPPMLTAQQALDHLLSNAKAVGESETVTMQAALGRVLAENVNSLVDVPPLDNTSMDGYAVRCADTTTPGQTLRIAQRIPAGSVGTQLEPGTAARIFTGAPVPTGADAVVTICQGLKDDLVTRGNNPSQAKPLGEPGALKVFGFEGGRLTNRASIAPGGRGGLGYGPRHLDFHPSKPWAYVLVELQNLLHMHRIGQGNLAPEPDYSVPITQSAPQPGIIQVAGAIHIHPRGHVLYASNRVSATTHAEGAFPFAGGENSIAVFALDPLTGKPRPIQFADPHGFTRPADRRQPVDPARRATRAQLVALGDGYFQTLENNTGEIRNTRFAPAAQRHENGMVFADIERDFRLGRYAFNNEVRRVPVLIDEERGIALFRGFIDHKGVMNEYQLTDGSPRTSIFREPHSWAFLEMFKIEDAMITGVEATFISAPYKSTSPFGPGNGE